MSDLSNIPNDNKPPKQVWLPLGFSIAMIIGMWIGMKLKNEPNITILKKPKLLQAPETDAFGQGRMEEALRYIDAKYVDAIDRKKLVDKAMGDLLQELDPHSVLIPASDVNDVNDDLEGEFDGIGVEVVILQDTATVVTPLAGGPAAIAGVLPNDKIVTIRDSSAVGKNVDYKFINNKLKGKKGVDVKLGILRGNEKKLREITVTRGKIPLNSVDVALMMDESTGYIKINRFSAATYDEFMKGLSQLVEKNKMKNLILDLRDNPGGYLEQACQILSQLFDEKDKLFVYTEGRAIHRAEYKSTGRKRFDVQKIAVLIDEGSASASEIVAGALQDWDRGVIIGRRSFGKGLIQEQYPLKDASALRLTVGRYYTPSGRSIQKSYKTKNKKEYEDETENRLKSGELTTADSIHDADTMKYYTAGGRIVHGGGGITPDIFVPVEPFYNNDYYHKLLRFIPEYAYLYAEKHASDLHFTLKEFDHDFKLNDVVFNDLIDYTEKKGVKRDKSQLEVVKEAVKTSLKARIAKNLFGEEGFFAVLNDHDPVVRRAVSQLKLNDPVEASKIAGNKK